MGHSDDLISVLPVGYQTLFHRVAAHLERDERVRAAWLSGSLARDAADAASDLDLIVAVADDDYEAFVLTWRDWLAELTPTVLAKELPFARGSFYSVTPTYERLDVIVESVGSTSSSPHRYRVPILDRDSLTTRVPQPDRRGPSAAAVLGLVEEYFRISAVDTIIVRDDWLLAREHLHAVSSLIYRMFVEANAPLPPMGVKQWSAKLTESQRDVLLGLPTSAANLEDLRVNHLALAEVFLTNAEALRYRLGFAWPAELEAAAAAHVGRQLQLATPYPRGTRIVV